MTPARWRILSAGAAATAALAAVTLLRLAFMVSPADVARAAFDLTFIALVYVAHREVRL